jgi:hypothetical protein
MARGAKKERRAERTHAHQRANSRAPAASHPARKQVHDILRRTTQSPSAQRGGSDDVDQSPLFA